MNKLYFSPYTGGPINVANFAFVNKDDKKVPAKWYCPYTNKPLSVAAAEAENYNYGSPQCSADYKAHVIAEVAKYETEIVEILSEPVTTPVE